MRMRLHSLLLCVAITGCEQAARYPAATTSAAPPSSGPMEPLPAHWSWLPPVDEPPRDAPIEFVPSSSPRWASLPAFWNPDPLPSAGARTIYIGLPPLQAVVAYGMAEQLQVFRIKLP